jgi:SAP domain-containing ribonucleoprotein
MSRAERFGITKLEQAGAAGSKKRDAAAVEEVDLDEQERRRKRAERFGIPAVVRFKLNCPMICRC